MTQDATAYSWPTENLKSFVAMSYRLTALSWAEHLTSLISVTNTLLVPTVKAFPLDHHFGHGTV